MVKVWSDIAWKDYCRLFDKHQQKLIKSTHDLIKDKRRSEIDQLITHYPLQIKKPFPKR